MLELLDDMVEQTIEIGSASRRAIDLGNVEVFVERHVERNGREIQDFRQSDLRDDGVHESQAIEFPILAILADIFTRFCALFQTVGEELHGKDAVIIGSKRRQGAAARRLSLP